MNKKPLIFNLLAITLLALAVSFPIQISLIYGHEMSDMVQLGAIWNKLPINNLLTMLLLSVTAWKIWKVETSIMPWLTASCIVVAANNFIVSSYASDWSQLQTTSSTIAFAILLGSFMFTKAYDHSLQPQMQWWKPAKRHRIDAPVVIEFMEHHRFQAQLFDMSSTGMFITGVQQQLISSLAPEQEEMAIKIPFKNQFHAFTVKLVRKTEQRGHYPGGWGLSFSHLNIWQRLKINWMLMNNRAAFTF
ncbi:MAG: hypothetical protein CME71_06320 [Halobacteriovorax sp.]|nr:hypothetical protein [Halobacteriovorax sp.]